MALTEGSIAFVGYDADGAQRFAIVAVDDLPAGTEIFITDRAWNGTSFQSGTTEGTLTWTVPTGGIASGTVLSFDNVNSNSLTIAAEKGGVTVSSVGTVSRTGGFDLEQANEVLYAYTGSINSPSSFLAAIGNGPSSPNTGGNAFSSTSNGVLTNTGLVAGQTAVNLAQVDGGADFAVYKPDVGGSAFPSRTAMLNAISNPANWMTGDTSADDSTGRVPFLTSSGSPIENVNFVVDIIPCFLPGTRIATPSGQVAVETLAPGDLVMTADGRAVPVRFVGRRTVMPRFAGAEKANPIRIAAGALDENVPSRDLFVSPNHGIVVDGVLAFASALVNGSTIAQVAGPGLRFAYYAIETEGHEAILAENCPAETFMDHVPRSLWENHADYVALHPDEPQIPEMDLPHAKSYRQVPADIHARIAARAAALALSAAA